MSTLYERLGGGDAIYRLVSDAVDLHLANPLVSARFAVSEDLDRAKRMGADFFCAGAGGPEEYRGKDLLSAHRGMNISEQEFIAVVDDILEAMDRHGHGDDLKAEVLAILYSLKDQVIRV